MKDKTNDSVKAILSSFKDESIVSSSSGRPYTLLASKGEDKLYFNLSYGQDTIDFNGKGKIVVAGIILRFRSTAKNPPVPARSHAEESSLLEKYFLPAHVYPVNGFALRQAVNDLNLLQKSYDWISARMKEPKWKMEMPLENFKLYGLSPFENLPEKEEEPDFTVIPMPTW